MYSSPGESVVLVVAFLWVQREVPSLPPEPAAAEAVLTAYQQLSDTVLERFLDLYDAMATKSLLPVFTAIPGYIFGSAKYEAG